MERRLSGFFTVAGSQFFQHQQQSDSGPEESDDPAKKGHSDPGAGGDSHQHDQCDEGELVSADGGRCGRHQDGHASQSCDEE